MMNLLDSLMADPDWKTAGILTLTHALAAGVPAQAQPVPSGPAASAAADYVCAVTMSNNKDVKAAAIIDRATNKPIYMSGDLEGPRGGSKVGTMRDALGNQVIGRFAVKVHPEDSDLTISNRPQYCTADGKQYEVQIPRPIEHRLFKH